VLPSASVTIAFFKSFLYPELPLKDLILPFKIEVFTFVTLTLNIISIALFISITLESLLTIKGY